MSNHPKKPELEFLCQLNVGISPSYPVGHVGEGVREVIPITGGTIVGPKLNGKILPGGADWATGYANGVWRIWARYTIQLDDGTLVGVTNSGVGRDCADKIFRGQTWPVFELAEGKHDWLRNISCVGMLEASVETGIVKIDLWQVT